MNQATTATHLRIPLSVSAAESARLARLQEAFNRACNHLANIARAHRCWSRVALHHLGYKAVREAQPELGAQMTCNAVYAVCRACLAIYQNPDQPWGPKARQPVALPTIVFSNRAPIYLDRHTLTLKHQQASIYTLEGRMHCALAVGDEAWARLHSDHIVQTTLQYDDQGYALAFQFEAGLPERARNRPRSLAPTEVDQSRHLHIQPTPPDGSTHQHT